MFTFAYHRDLNKLNLIFAELYADLINYKVNSQEPIPSTWKIFIGEVTKPITKEDLLNNSAFLELVDKDLRVQVERIVFRFQDYCCDGRAAFRPYSSAGETEKLVNDYFANNTLTLHTSLNTTNRTSLKEYFVEQCFIDMDKMDGEQIITCRTEFLADKEIADRFLMENGLNVIESWAEGEGIAALQYYTVKTDIPLKELQDKLWNKMLRGNNFDQLHRLIQTMMYGNATEEHWYAK